MFIISVEVIAVTNKRHQEANQFLRRSKLKLSKVLDLVLEQIVAVQEFMDRSLLLNK
jgi:hypothetical protein